MTYIGDYAFKGCVGLTSIIILSNDINMGKDVLDGCTSLKDIYVNIKDPKNFVLDKVDTFNVTLHVPTELGEVYRNTRAFQSKFAQIVADVNC